MARIPAVASTLLMAEPAVGRPAPGPSRHVLIVEDQEDVRQSLRVLLELGGHRVEEAADGAEGLRSLLALRPDVALVDVGLPGLDGCALARTVRQSPGGAGLFLVALTGYGQAEDRRRTLAAGFNVHLTKPVAEAALSESARACRAGAERPLRPGYTL